MTNKEIMTQECECDICKKQVPLPNLFCNCMLNWQTEKTYRIENERDYYRREYLDLLKSKNDLRVRYDEAMEKIEEQAVFMSQAEKLNFTAANLSEFIEYFVRTRLSVPENLKVIIEKRIGRKYE